MSKIKTVIFSALLLTACRDKAHHHLTADNQSADSLAAKADSTIPFTRVKATDLGFFSGSVFHGYRGTLQFYFKKYGSDSCKPIVYEKSVVVKDFSGVINLGNIHRATTTAVFVLNPLNHCSFKNEKTPNGQAYYFTDTTLPRLQTDTYCCSPNNLFLVGDINEDGISELGEYRSSCSGRLKTLYVYTLKKKYWKEVGHCLYDLRYADDAKPYNSFIKKTGKKKFEMLEITDMTEDKSKAGQPNWIRFTM